MDKFAEAYAKARSVLAAQKFEADWEKLLKTEIDVLTLLGADGPNQRRAEDPVKLRCGINDHVFEL